GYFNPDLPGSGLGWIELGTDVDWVLAFEPGMNDRGLVSFVSGTLDEAGSREPTNILVGVVDIADPAKPIIDVARAGRDGVVRLHGASSINNMNEVVFVGSDTAAPFRVI